MTTSTDHTRHAEIYEYGSAANPEMRPIPVLVHPPELHESGPSRIIPFDLSKHLNAPEQQEGEEQDNSSSPATSPNLLASFVRILPGEQLDTQATATSQAFYVIRGRGESSTNLQQNSKEMTTMTWSTGDLFVLPHTPGAVTHKCFGNDGDSKDKDGSAALYWIHDQPLLDYLGVLPNPKTKTFEPTLYKREALMAKVDEIRHDQTRSTNRLGVLLGNTRYQHTTKTLTHVLWSLLNSIGPHSIQRPHRHNSVALDLCVAAPPGGQVYTLMGREIDDRGLIINPIRVDWVPGGCFVTPPGWWHSHHNESSDQEAWVLPIQDAGLLTHQRTLDIRFVDDELALHHAGRIRGSAFVVTDEQWEHLYEMKVDGDKAAVEATEDDDTNKENNQKTITTQETNDDDVSCMDESTMDATVVDSNYAAFLGSVDEDHPVENKPKRRYSIQVGHLARQAVAEQHQEKDLEVVHRKSIQVGADLKHLKSFLPRDL